MLKNNCFLQKQCCYYCNATQRSCNWMRKCILFSVQVREKQPGVSTWLEGEAGHVHTSQRGGGAERQEQQRLRCQITGAAHGCAQPAGEQVIQEMVVTSFWSLPDQGAAHQDHFNFLETRKCLTHPLSSFIHHAAQPEVELKKMV